MKKLPVCMIYQDDSFEIIVQKALKTLQNQGIKSNREEFYKEQACVMMGRIKHAKSERHALLIMRYYVRMIEHTK